MQFELWSHKQQVCQEALPCTETVMEPSEFSTTPLPSTSRLQDEHLVNAKSLLQSKWRVNVAERLLLRRPQVRHWKRLLLIAVASSTRADEGTFCLQSELAVLRILYSKA